MLAQTFGDMLLRPESKCFEEFPSPEELKHRIIISTKPPKEYLEAKEDEKLNSSQREKDSDDDAWGQEPSSLTANQQDQDKVLCRVIFSLVYFNLTKNEC